VLQPYESTLEGQGLEVASNPTSGVFIKMGAFTSFHIVVDLSKVTNFGTGAYSVRLPSAPFENYSFRDCYLYDSSANQYYPVFVHAKRGEVMAELFFLNGARELPMDHNSPKKLDGNDLLYLSGNYGTP
jgi:hypothetical protein